MANELRALTAAYVAAEAAWEEAKKKHPRASHSPKRGVLAPYREAHIKAHSAWRRAFSLPALHEAFELAAAPPPWKLIETAPQDGTYVLVWGPRFAHPMVGWCVQGAWATAHGAGYAPGQITHWSVLREAPRV